MTTGESELIESTLSKSSSPCSSYLLSPTNTPPFFALTIYLSRISLKSVNMSKQTSKTREKCLTILGLTEKLLNVSELREDGTEKPQELKIRSAYRQKALEYHPGCRVWGASLHRFRIRTAL